ncbi:helix-turn-helix transcriptional regulator [Paenibacillus daejeonensis]|uniref:helix-turn-helix transcriptional regulator n=1 Tax=Paenibacillus daejeonensis TaxID=135193 RepID=UPI00036C86CF|nr:helix-turn-helix domain-containing protein [Paenibacillus daejeonensis]
MFNALLVDPSIYSREKTRLILERHPAEWRISGYADGYEEAAAMLAAASDDMAYALIIIQMNGGPAEQRQLFARVSQSAALPVILLGGHASWLEEVQAPRGCIRAILPEPAGPKALQAALADIRRDLEQPPGAGTPKSWTGGTPCPDIEKVKSYVEQELHCHVTLKKISNRLHLNCAYLGQKFKLHENITFHEYLLRQRMEKAKTLLAQTSLKVYEVAREVGYSETDWFYKKFKAYTGVSANAYRKQTSITA